MLRAIFLWRLHGQYYSPVTFSLTQQQLLFSRLRRWWSHWLDDGRSGFLLVPPKPSFPSLLHQCLPSPFTPSEWYPGALWLGGHDLSAARGTRPTRGLLPVWTTARERAEAGKMRQGSTAGGSSAVQSAAICIILDDQPIGIQPTSCYPGNGRTGPAEHLWGAHWAIQNSKTRPVQLQSPQWVW